MSSLLLFISEKDFLALHMFLYNVSIIVEDGSHDQVFDWLSSLVKNQSLPIKLLKMLDSPHEGTTYCLQLTTDDESILQGFQQSTVADLQAYIGLNHREKAFIFDSKMQFLA